MPRIKFSQQTMKVESFSRGLHECTRISRNRLNLNLRLLGSLREKIVPYATGVQSSTR